MASIVDISKSFGVESLPLSTFFRRPGVGYYIPLYQREYSWDQENVSQLLDDITRGVLNMLEDSSTIHFMGAVILLRESDKAKNIDPVDMRGLPEAVEHVIDGQQRISTLSLLASVLYERIFELQNKLSGIDALTEIRQEATGKKLKLLLEMFSNDHGRGDPERKPLIIRGSVDEWTYSSGDDKYKSEAANFLARFIRSGVVEQVNPTFPKAKGTGRVAKNLRQMAKYIEQRVEYSFRAIDDAEERFPTPIEIIDRLAEESLWSFPRPAILEILRQGDPANDPSMEALNRLVSLFAFCHFLFDRCCVTTIQPTKEEWAFDMFQSLNATGTPLTAVETFKPLVVHKYGTSFKSSQASLCFQFVDKYLDSAKTSSAKTRLTNEYLTLLAVLYDGSKMRSQFSFQRSMLNKWFSAGDEQQRIAFLMLMRDISQYLHDVQDYTDIQIQNIPSIQMHPEAAVATLCVAYLRDAGHKMANTILSLLYRRVISGGGPDDFVRGVKAVAAFFTLWRAARDNRGLDDVYRQLFSKGGQSGLAAAAVFGNQLSVSDITKYLIEQLDDLNDHNAWMVKAKQNLRYNHAKHVCRFCLLLSADNAIPDMSTPGLMKIGRPSSTQSYFTPVNWVSDSFKSIEHVAPNAPKASGGWDEALYEEEGFHSIGNLTLMPLSLNSSAGNRSWQEKLLYYKHLAASDPALVAVLKEEADAMGIKLAESTVELLRSTKYNRHLEPIVSIGYEGAWNSDLVESRTERICEIVWVRMREWLSE